MQFLSQIALDNGTARIKGRILETKKVNGDVFYKAKVEVKTPDGTWKVKKEASTFFPDNWSQKKIQKDGVRFATTYKKKFDINISTSDESRVIINHLDTTRSTQFPYYKKGVTDVFEK